MVGIIYAIETQIHGPMIKIRDFHHQTSVPLGNRRIFILFHFPCPSAGPLQSLCKSHHPLSKASRSFHQRVLWSCGVFRGWNPDVAAYRLKPCVIHIDPHFGVLLINMAHPIPLELVSFIPHICNAKQFYIRELKNFNQNPGVTLSFILEITTEASI